MEPLDEYTPARPLNYSGYTKVEAEKIVQSMAARHFMVHLAWQYGFEEPVLPKSRDGLLKQIIDSYRTKQKIPYTKGACQNINCIYDTVDAILAMVYGKVPCGVCNLCSPNTLDDRGMKEYILKKLNASREKMDELLVEDTGAKPFDLRAAPHNLMLSGYKLPTFEEGINRCFKEMVIK